jgi:hypothetical protein
MSQLTFIETGWHNHTRPFQYVLEGLSGFGTTPTSATMVIAPMMNDVTETYTRLTNQHFGDNSYTYFRAQDLGLRWGWNVKFAPSDIVLIKILTKLPNYTTPTDNLANSATYYRAWNQGAAAYTLAEHHQALKGTRCKTFDLVINGGIIDITADMSSRQVTPQSTTQVLPGTPVLKAFSDITVTPWTHVDNGSLPLQVNSVTYPQDNFHLNIANALNEKAYNGSRLIDTNKVMKQTVTGDFMAVVGKDLLLEGFFDDVALANVPLVYAVKPASATVNLTDVNLKVMSKTQSGGADDEWRLNISFDARLQTIT